MKSKAGVNYWLPYKQAKHWYVLDNNEGEETIYLVASRERNPKFEGLIDNLRSASLEKEFNLMGIARLYSAGQGNQALRHEIGNGYLRPWKTKSMWSERTL